jgi:signal transduction histidine kinase
MIEPRDLRSIAVFSDLSEEQLAWLAAHAKEVCVEPGDALFHEGDPADHMIAFLEGQLEARSERASDGRRFSVRAGEVSGLLPFSRLQTLQGTGRAVGRVRAAIFHKSIFQEMLHEIPALTERLVILMLDRTREATRATEQRDKLAALGKLSAGLAHELNNPAAAAKRAATAIWDVRKQLRGAFLRLDQQNLTREQRTYIAECEEQGLQVVLNPEAAHLGSVERSDREQEIEDWLSARGVPQPWETAPTLVEAGMEPAKLAEIAETVGPDALPDVLLRIHYSLSAARMVQEIGQSATRIFELVQAIKEYTYMDQAAEQEIDIHTGIESTLTILAHKLRKKSIRVEREYDRSIPKICAYGVELNQVWTNLIVNAIEAMPEGGQLRLRTGQNPKEIEVEVQDNGAGIPADVLPHIFEPFFTTKGVGDGTGLGLDTALRVVRKHKGALNAYSEPGATTFRVCLPKPSTPATS